MHERRLRRLTRLAISILAVVAAACGSSASPTPTAPATATPSPSAAQTQSIAPSPSAVPTPNPSADLAVYAQIETQVQQLRQLTAKKTVTPTLLDEAGVKSWMTKANEQGIDHVALASQSRLFAHLGLLPAGASLEQLELDLNSGQAIGFYDPQTGGLYLLSEGGTVGPEQKITFSHEFTHALQDQNFGLDKLAVDTPDQGDRDLARVALPEGDASLSMTQWAQANMSISDLLALSLSSATAEQQAQLDAAPAILREDLLFPYVQGLAFIESIYAPGGWAAVDRLYSNPPASTSQILHPQLYRSGVKPVAVTLPSVPASLGSGWKLSFQDTMGELQLGVWLEGEHPTAAQRSAAESSVSAWAGDRIGLYEGSNGGWAVVLATQWRGGPAATAFNTAVGARLPSLTGPSKTCASGSGMTIYLASDGATLGAFASC